MLLLLLPCSYDCTIMLLLMLVCTCCNSMCVCPCPPCGRTYIVYLLRQLLGTRTYVGKTWKQPWYRCSQHNGEHPGAAATTATGRPWTVVCYVRGFYDEGLALSFETAWQRGRGANCLRPFPPTHVSRGVLGKMELLNRLLRCAKWRPHALSVHMVSPNVTAPLHDHRHFAAWNRVLANYRRVTRNMREQ